MKKKLCTRCRQKEPYKNFASCKECREYSINFKRKLRSGEHTPRPKDALTYKEKMAITKRERAAWRKRMEEDPELARLIKEDAKFIEDAERREQGLPPVEVKKSSYRRDSKSELLEIGPFQEWIEKRLTAYDSIDTFAMLVETSARTVHRWRTGREVDKRGKERIINKIPLNTVDIAITREGSTNLWELYPELYE
jgi:hypothetical protein